MLFFIRLWLAFAAWLGALVISAPVLADSISAGAFSFGSSGSDSTGKSLNLGVAATYNMASPPDAENFFSLGLEYGSVSAPASGRVQDPRGLGFSLQDDEDSADTDTDTGSGDTDGLPDTGGSAAAGGGPSSTLTLSLGGGRRIHFGGRDIGAYPFFYFGGQFSYGSTSTGEGDAAVSSSTIGLGVALGPGVRIPFSDDLFLDVTIELSKSNLLTYTSTEEDSSVGFGIDVDGTEDLARVGIALGYDLDGKSGVGFISPCKAADRKPAQKRRKRNLANKKRGRR